MEFNEKLQQLRKRKGITQEELAQALYVSRAAVSKWESGRGWPNIDSLKAIARFYEVTIDELLSGEELLTIAEEDSRQKGKDSRRLLFGLMDCGGILLFFLPLFGSRGAGGVDAVSLFSLSAVSSWLVTVYEILVTAMIGAGILTLALRDHHDTIWTRNRERVSCILNGVGALLFTVSLQPYAAAFLFLFLAIKAQILMKWR